MDNNLKDLLEPVIQDLIACMNDENRDWSRHEYEAMLDRVEKVYNEL
jgi:hypothetical protein